MKRLYLILFFSLISRHLIASTDLEVSFAHIAKINEEMKFWEEELKRLEKQKNKGNVSPAYLMMLNAILVQMHTLRKQAVALIEEIRTEEERIKNKQESAQSNGGQ